VKVIYGVWDRRTEFRNYPTLCEYMDGIHTVVREQAGRNGLIQSDDPDEILRLAAAESSATHIAVLSSGQAIIPGGFGYFLVNVERLCKRDDFLVAGHIMMRPQEPDTYPHLHEQMFVVDLRRYRQIGAPLLGRFELGSKMLQKVRRSSDNVHDDYTPLDLSRGHGLVETTRRKLGWSLIHHALHHKMGVTNLPTDLRTRKIHLYPDDRPDRIEQLLANEGPLPADLNGGQRHYLEVMRGQMKGADAIYVFNTEGMDDHKPMLPPRRFIAPASGFRSFLLWWEWGADPDAEIVLYDFQDDALAFCRQVYERWDGHDFEAFFTENWSLDERRFDFGIRPRRPAHEWLPAAVEGLVNRLGSEDALAAAWARYRAVSHRFVRIDLFREPEALVDLLAGDRDGVWLSNIFAFAPALFHIGKHRIGPIFRDLVAALQARSPSVLVSGISPDHVKFHDNQYGGTVSAWRDGSLLIHHPKRLPGVMAAIESG